VKFATLGKLSHACAQRHEIISTDIRCQAHIALAYVEDSIFKYSEAVELVCPIYHHFNAPSDAVGSSKGWEGAR